MRITKHISFFYLEDRIFYINNIIDETNKYEYITDIYIHTNNKDLQKDSFNKYTNGTIEIIYHDLTKIHPHYLTWKCRDLLQQQKDDYDIFMYIEDDILVPRKTLEYWLQRNEELIELNYNLGFAIIEINDKGEEYYQGLCRNTYIDKSIVLNDTLYCINDKNPYCAFWIYNKKEFERFTESIYFDIIGNVPGYGPRESSAVGLHGINPLYWYKGTVIPIVNNKLTDDCKIYHMPNNYVKLTAIYDDCKFSTIKFADALKLA